MPGRPTLSAIFWAQVRAAADGAGAEDLGPLLGELVAAGSAAWPELDLPAATFVRHLGAHVPADEDVTGWLREVNAPDLFLACACLHGIPGALAAFEGSLLGQLPVFLSRVDPAGAHLDEVRQRLCERLFVGARGRPPRIADYSGIGPLRRWVRVAAVRTALNLRKAEGRARHRDAYPALHALHAAHSPEIAYLKARHHADFTQALLDAMATLTPEQRNLLRLRFLHGLGLERLAAIFQINRATVSRWLVGAREAILAETKRLLRERLRLDTGELESLIRILRSDLDASLVAVLREGAGGEE